MKRFAFLTDIHANLPAFKATLTAIANLNCDDIFIGGDVIGIGPYPAECMDLVIKNPNIHMVNGNHEIMATIEESRLYELCESEGELNHTLWYREQLSEEHIQFIQENPISRLLSFESVKVLFFHYFLTTGFQIYPFLPIFTKDQLQRQQELVYKYSANLICLGHDHKPLHMTAFQSGTILYNPGSLGCSKQAEARFAVIECDHGEFRIISHTILYDDCEILSTFETRKVPERDFICKTFYGDRFTKG